MSWGDLINRVARTISEKENSSPDKFKVEAPQLMGDYKEDLKLDMIVDAVKDALSSNPPTSSSPPTLSISNTAQDTLITDLLAQAQQWETFAVEMRQRADQAERNAQTLRQLFEQLTKTD